MRLLAGRGLEGEHRAVHQGRFAEGAPLEVEPLLAAQSTTAPEASGPQAADARAEATAASAVPAGAVTRTSQARPGADCPPRGASTVSRICIAVSNPFCAGHPARDRPDRPRPAGRHEPWDPGPRRRRAGGNRPHGCVLRASSHLPPTTRPGPTLK
ncbi:hypothetical protein ACFQ60_20965 [Streptomyces zhihengii]